MDARDVELRLDLGAELVAKRMRGGEVRQFIRIIDKIVELVGIDRRVDEFPGPTPQHVHGGDGALGQIFAPGGALWVFMRA